MDKIFHQRQEHAPGRSYLLSAEGYLFTPRLKPGASAAHVGPHRVPATPTPRTAVPDTEFSRDKWIRME
jgi:hypothetical protein